jgi:ribonuclease P protein component
VTTAFGYPRTASLRHPAEFTALRRQGKRMAARFFQSQYRLTDGAEARLGMAVSRRVSKRAVVRNRIRRVIRESFRLHRARLPACDVLLIAQTTAAEQGSRELRADLEALWQRLAALKNADPAGTMPARS